MGVRPPRARTTIRDRAPVLERIARVPAGARHAFRRAARLRRRQPVPLAHNPPPAGTGVRGAAGAQGGDRPHGLPPGAGHGPRRRSAARDNLRVEPDVSPRPPRLHHRASRGDRSRARSGRPRGRRPTLHVRPRSGGPATAPPRGSDPVGAAVAGPEAPLLLDRRQLGAIRGFALPSFPGRLAPGEGSPRHGSADHDSPDLRAGAGTARRRGVPRAGGRSGVRHSSARGRRRERLRGDPYAIGRAAALSDARPGRRAGPRGAYALPSLHRARQSGERLGGREGQRGVRSRRPTTGVRGR